MSSKLRDWDRYHATFRILIDVESLLEALHGGMSPRILL